jgi:hypothetical protein
MSGGDVTVVAVKSTAPAAPDRLGADASRTVPAADRPLARRIAAALRPPYSKDLGVCLLFVAIAGWLTHGLWPDPATRTLALNADDQILNEWFLAFDTRVLFGDFTLVTARLNAPDGVNLLANASVIAIGVLLSPITVAFGAPVTFALAVAGNLAGTATAWFLFLQRGLGLRRAAAAAGGLFCGFAPAMVSQSNSHLHMTSQWLVPLIAWSALRMARAADPDRPDNADWVRRLLTSAVALAALVTVQLFIGEEVLFLTALTLAAVTVGYAVVRPVRAVRSLPRFAAGMLVATGLATAALLYPLWVQFAGPQHVPNGPFSPAYFSADLASFPAFSPLSLAGSPDSARLSTGSAEYNSFLGWPLLLLVAGCVWWLRRTALVWGLVLASVAMAWLSLGPQIVINGQRTQHAGLYVLLEGRKVVDAALPLRFAVALVPLVATLLALALDRALREPPGQPARLVVPVAIAAALLPIAPRPLPAVERAPVPAFIAQGLWRECVEPGGVLVPVPLPTPPEPEAMRWAAATNVAFGLPEGFFIGPYGAEGTASMGTYSQPTSHLLAEVARTGQVPAVGDGERDQARKDLAFWNASCVALADGPNEEQLRTTLEALLGPGRQLAGTWAWKVS